MNEFVRDGDLVFQKAPRSNLNLDFATMKNVKWGFVGKRGLDITVSAVSIFLVLPVLVALCACVWMSDGGSPIFKHRRIGRNGRQFFCLKIRSMVSNSQEVLQHHLATNSAAREEWARNQKLSDDPRVTRLGRFLRKSSLDELPQLFNVLRGEMSLVGPRPIVDAEIARYGDSFDRCFSVPPGITGLWQVSGRSDCGYADRVELDLKYTQAWRLSRDLYILAMTVPAVLWQKGSY